MLFINFIFNFLLKNKIEGGTLQFRKIDKVKNKMENFFGKRTIIFCTFFKI